ncbi:MAG: methyltransferase [Ardenticatenaceae bacterium]
MNDQTVLDTELGPIRILHPPGTFALTPASRIGIRAIVANRALLQGSGIDWGSGTGCLALTAAKIAAVRQVTGLELSEPDVRIARQNARLNAVERKVTFFHANSYAPFSPEEREAFDALAGQTDFILANPPSSEGGDGFGYRRVVLSGAQRNLRHGGVLFLSISYQYGVERIAQLTEEIGGFTYGGVLATTGWVPFDLARPDLLHCLELYAQEEDHGGLAYAFAHPEAPDDEPLTARAALDYYQRTGRSPLSRWQAHLFRRQ